MHRLIDLKTDCWHWARRLWTERAPRALGAVRRERV